jgi:hypothetical protein
MSNELKLFFEVIKKKFHVLRNWMLNLECWNFLLELRSPGAGSEFGFKTLVIPSEVLKIAMFNKKVIIVHIIPSFSLLRNTHLGIQGLDINSKL